MKNCVLLIIVFINVIHCSDLNISDETVSTCPFRLFRRKREQEYTRWRANLESTPEFIVKVFDEDLTTLRNKKVIAVNMPHPNIGGEKIIIGGVMVPQATPTDPPETVDAAKDYTRFMPPTTTSSASTPNIFITDEVKVMKPPGRHPQRDESPPAGPQFLPRASSATWQYAPITPVGFTRRTTIAPITPSTDISDERIQYTHSIFSTPITPSRTPPDDEEFRKYHQLDYAAYTSTPNKITENLLVEPEILTEMVTKLTKEFEENQEQIADIDSQIKSTYTDTVLHTDKKIDMESDPTYQMMFYHDEDQNNEKKELEESFVETTEIIPKIEVSSESYIVQTEVVTFEEVNTEVGDAQDYRAEVTYDQNMRTFGFTPRRAFAELNETKNSENAGNNNTVEEVDIEDYHQRHKTICSMVAIRQLSFNAPRTLPEIVYQMKQWAESSPVAKWVDITEGNLTTMENPIYMMIVDDPSSGQIVSAKQTVMIVAGIQGRDHHAVSSAMYVLYQLIERSESHTDLLTKFRFWIIPVFNPDGYDYSMTFPHRREWTKNLRQNWDICSGRDYYDTRDSCHSCESFGLKCTVQPCYGVNLDRNFEYQWIPAEELRSEYPCGSLYPGARQLSEVETQSLTKFLREINTPVFTFIAFKEGDVLGIMYPYSHTKKRRSLDQIYRHRASQAAAAAYSISGRPYVAGQTSEFLPLYAGGIEDWVDSHMGIDNTYTIAMFRPSDTYNSKLITERVFHEAFAAMDTLVLQSGVETVQPEVAVLRNKISSGSMTEPSKLHLLVFILVYLILDNLSSKLS